MYLVLGPVSDYTVHCTRGHSGRVGMQLQKVASVSVYVLQETAVRSIYPKLKNGPHEAKKRESGKGQRGSKKNSHLGSQSWAAAVGGGGRCS
jgi:hypothetical protein